MNNLTFYPSKILIKDVNVINYKVYYNNQYIAEFCTFKHWDGLNFCNFEIKEEYRGLHLAKKILSYAVNTLKCENLSVEKTNKIALNMYISVGFKIVDEDEIYYYMSI